MHPDLLPTITALSDARRTATTDDYKSSWGQYFTPPQIAAFMASMVHVVPGQHLSVLDPGAGTGILGAAVARVALAAGASSVRLVAVEAEPETRALLQRSMAFMEIQLGSAFSPQVRGDDFLDLHEPRIGVAPLPVFDAVIANPPYFKMSPTEVRGGDAPNAYARFMEVAAHVLRPGGQLVFIVPRSFASGYYFRRFRSRFHAGMALESVHLFDSRSDAFSEDEVLQENIIVAYRKGGVPRVTIEVSSSAGVSDLDQRRCFEAPRELVFLPSDPAGVLYLPAGPQDAATMRAVQAWPERLSTLGLDISTGPVVPFRTDAIRREADAETVPLLWMQHVRAGAVRWPLGAGFRKTEHIRLDAGNKLLVPNRTYVLMRRFSAKEEARRLTVAVLERGRLPGAWLGLENHLNFIHQPGGELEPRLAWGLGALLGSTLIDDYFRIQSGNTQVSATEIRALPLPGRALLERLGDAARAVGADVIGCPGRIDAIVSEILLDA